MSTNSEQAPPRRVGPVRYVVARVGDIPEGERLITEVGGRTIGVFNIKGRFHALLHQCPHNYGPLCEGALQKRVYTDKPGQVIKQEADRVFLSCPWHGWLFDLETGQSWWDPVTTRARPFPVEVTSGEEIVECLNGGGGSEPVPGPYVAEKYAVEVEDNYVVVMIRPRAQRAPTDASL